VRKFQEEKILRIIWVSATLRSENVCSIRPWKVAEIRTGVEKRRQLKNN